MLTMFDRCTPRIRTLALGAAVSLAASAAQAQSTFGPWDWVSPTPQGSDLRDVFLIDANTAVAVGLSATILRTTDGGTTWTNCVTGFEGRNPHETPAFSDVEFVDASTGIALGSNNSAGLGPAILRTTDGGVTWTRQPNPCAGDINTFSGGVSMNSVAFPDPNTAYAAGDGSQSTLCNGVARDGPIFLKSTDGGQTWQDLSDAPGWNTPASINDIAFPEADVGYATIFARGGPVRRTDDGGQTWQSVDIPTSEVPDNVYFTSANYGYVTCSDAQIWHTTNGGQTWTQQASNTTYGLHDIYFINDNTGWVAGGNDGRPFIARTDNGGQTWVPQDPGQTPPLAFFGGVHFLDANTGMLASLFGNVLRTDDGGDSWTQLSGGFDIRRLAGVDFADADTGWAVGANDSSSILPGVTTIVRTTDAGRTWTIQDSGIFGSGLADVAAIDANTATAVGGDGTILRTTDGGNSWVPQVSGTTEHLRGVHFIDADTGWVATDYVTGSETTPPFQPSVLRTTDGGATWTQHFVPVTGTAWDLFFVDANTGWVAGAQGSSSPGYVARTTDGGVTWVDQTPALPVVSGGFLSVFFLDANTGWVAGRKGIAHTTDGGATWTAQFDVSPLGINFNDISFADANTGTAVAINGVIYRTEDGGQTWEPEPRRMNRPLNAVVMLDADTAIAVSGGTFGIREDVGIILRRSGDDGGCSLADITDPLGTIDVFDLLAYLDLWFADDAMADIDGAAGIDVFDLLTYLDAWFAGCG